MATYKDIRGTNVKTVSSDPPAPVNGQVWYNSTDQVMKGFTDNPAGSWSTGGALNTGRSFVGDAGTQTAGLIFGGTPGNPTIYANTESYNGTSWTELNDLPATNSSLAGAGTQTSAIAAGGNPPVTANAFSWNGTSWTSTPSLNQARFI